MTEDILQGAPGLVAQGNAAASRRSLLLRLAVSGLQFFLLLLLLVAAYLGWFRLMGNFHAVVPGQVFRSEQLDAEGLREQTARHGLRSIVSLRGAHPGDPWYDTEIAVARAEGLEHHTVDLSAKHMIAPERLDEVLALIERVPKPVLIHCNAGADRSGLVAAALLLRRGATPQEADRQLSLRYGHFPWLGSRTVAMDRSYWRYVESQGPAISTLVRMPVAAGPDPD